ncbi:hypothetical protein ACJVDH_08395 [Pedobacter sp. AW1-32]|uniref:hypothetical protein n=1 Tax=Pedobacter sp. AW1-32 TaxID=3383026 RepID=UPI003FED41C6
MKFIYILAVIFLVIILVYRISKNYSSATVIPLPARFEKYQSIDSIETMQTGKASLDLLLQSQKNIEFFLTPDKYLVVYSMPSDKENQFIKIDTNGNVIDSLEIISKPENLIFLKGFIVDKTTKVFYKWSFNGSREPIKLISQNLDFKADSDEQNAQLTEILKKSTAVFLDFNFDSPAPPKQIGEVLQTTQGINSYAIVTYFIGEEGFQMYTQLNVHKYFSSSFLAQMAWNNLFKRLTAKNHFDGEIIKSSNIVYQYFQKQKLESVRFSGGGGSAPGFSKDLYPGFLFTDVIFKTDTFKIKEFMYLDEAWNTSSVEIEGKNIGALAKNKVQPVQNIDAYQYFADEKLHYVLFTNNDKKLYIIR